MYKSLITLVTAIIILSGNIANAQTDSLQLKSADSTQAQANQQADAGEDDDFNVFLLVIITAFVCAMIGAAIVGSFAAAFVILLVIAFVSAGVISASLFAGLYKRSVATGFKTFIMLICVIGGTAIGSAGLFLAKKIFHIHMQDQTAFITGAVGGLLGGLLLGWMVFKLIITSMGYLKKKLQIS